MTSRFALPLACALAAAHASAQTPPPRAPAADSPPYESAFKDYVPYKEPEIRGWREVNDEVARAGGHIGIFGGQVQGNPGTAGAKPPAAKPAPVHEHGK